MESLAEAEQGAGGEARGAACRAGRRLGRRGTSGGRMKRFGTSLPGSGGKCGISAEGALVGFPIREPGCRGRADHLTGAGRSRRRSGGGGACGGFGGRLYVSWPRSSSGPRVAGTTRASSPRSRSTPYADPARPAAARGGAAGVASTRFRIGKTLSPSVRRLRRVRRRRRSRDSRNAARSKSPLSPGRPPREPSSTSRIARAPAPSPHWGRPRRKRPASGSREPETPPWGRPPGRLTPAPPTPPGPRQRGRGCSAPVSHRHATASSPFLGEGKSHSLNVSAGGGRCIALRGEPRALRPRLRLLPTAAAVRIFSQFGVDRTTLGGKKCAANKGEPQLES